ncbi:hypothetical protein TNCV_3219121 [Trichonephila clavipes]|nr:hypothetical protein TNCV_3219121 [Trichonephila clavipes]
MSLQSKARMPYTVESLLDVRKKRPQCGIFLAESRLGGTIQLPTGATGVQRDVIVERRESVLFRGKLSILLLVVEVVIKSSGDWPNLSCKLGKAQC